MFALCLHGRACGHPDSLLEWSTMEPHLITAIAIQGHRAGPSCACLALSYCHARPSSTISTLGSNQVDHATGL
ncbi:uncharacterized protein MYCFIDRAFT_209729 [Pseudocercospora fijiensis CIRAD86]|uniref:Uncharacterized protein n=1 Tax=Pseudocercospora fijiensis (strain CIRAD86) TaxID=383855 RepID=N1QAW1_PSEFD|nr:uncharacterized protein MYCFIDRAFT_209729 [Pseudocercospora fijiensis CIRAD86]EME88182.1 hypothetical protein MYCFIDRAFT_209729 [Pseudocercospora fijiensis CIRAD86]